MWLARDNAKGCVTCSVVHVRAFVWRPSRLVQMGSNTSYGYGYDAVRLTKMLFKDPPNTCTCPRHYTFQLANMKPTQDFACFFCDDPRLCLSQTYHVEPDN